MSRIPAKRNTKICNINFCIENDLNTVAVKILAYNRLLRCGGGADSLSLISMHHIWARAGFDKAEWSVRAGFNIRAVAPVAVTGVSAMASGKSGGDNADLVSAERRLSWGRIG